MRPGGLEAPGSPVRSDADPKDRAWLSCTVADLAAAQGLQAPITVTTSTPCAEAVAVMKEAGVDQLPVVRPFPGDAGELEVIAVVSMATLSRHMLSHPDKINAPCLPYASSKFVVVTPACTLDAVVDALNAYPDRRTGDAGVVIVADDQQGKKLLRYVVSRVDVVAFETDSLARSK